MENLLNKIIEETENAELKAVAESVSNLDLAPEDMEQQLVTDGLFILETTHDSKD